MKSESMNLAIRLAVALCYLGVPVQARAQKAQAIEAKLDTVLKFDQALDGNTPLKDAIEYLSDYVKVQIKVNAAAFKDELMITAIEDQQVRLPKVIDISLASVLEILTRQVSGTYIVQKNFIEIVPKTKPRKETRKPSNRQKAAEQALSEKLKAKIKLLDAIPKDTSIEDAFQFLADNQNLNIFVDTLAFNRFPGGKPANQRTIELPKLENVSIQRVLQLMLEAAGGGDFELCGNLLIIVPEKDK